jgi:hypothetical protein
MIEFQSLSKVYGSFNAVKPLTLTVRAAKCSASSAQRRRQDHHHPHDDGHPGAQRRPC